MVLSTFCSFKEFRNHVLKLKYLAIYLAVYKVTKRNFPQAGVVETLGSEVDYNIYYNPVEGDRYVMPERALGLRDLDCNIPLHHVVQFIRDYKCFDTEVIQVF